MIHIADAKIRPRMTGDLFAPVYSAGTILLFMLTGRRFEILQWIEHPSLLDRVLDFHAYLGISYEAMDLLKHMLMLDPTHRYTLRQICAHPWMTQHT